VGKSYTEHGWGWRLSRVARLTAKTALAILLIPLCFDSYRKSLSDLVKEIRTGREKVVHYIPLQEATPPQGKLADAPTAREQDAKVEALILAVSQPSKDSDTYAKTRQ